MKGHNLFRRLMATALSTVMVLGLVPVSTASEMPQVNVNGDILAFTALPDETAIQTVSLGTPLEELDLPQTLRAAVYLVTDTAAPAREKSAQDSGEPQDGPIETTVAPAVAWASSPDYDGNAAGTYTFTAEVEGYALADGVQAPKITVTVEAAQSTSEITAFYALSDDVRWQNTTEPHLPETLSGTAGGKSTEIPVTWEADHDYDAEYTAKGLYVFTARPGEGYTLTAGVEAPRITVYIPVTTGRMMARTADAGTGTGPLEITTAAQLAEIATLVNAGRLETFLFNDSEAKVSFVLLNDIDLSAYGKNWSFGRGWTPIGTLLYEDASEQSYGFKGVFDGNDHVISGLYINDNTSSFAGLFGYLDGGTVQNLELEHVQITADSYVGGLAGAADHGSIMENCYVTGAVTGQNYVGGLAGGMLGTAKNCCADATVSGRNYVGGLMGGVQDSAVESCYAAGAVTGRNYTGGLTGSAQGGTVKNCYATGAVTGLNLVGGLAGYVNDSCTVETCYATGAVTGTVNYIGGLVGVINGSTLQSCAALGPGVTVTTDQTDEAVKAGRVIGNIADSSAQTYYGESTLSGNVAFSGMTITVGSEVHNIDDGAADNTNGEDKIAADVCAENFFSNLFGSDNPAWTYEGGKLPILRNITGGMQDIDLPAHLVDSVGGDENFPGEGTEALPYLISTAKQMARLAELVNAGNPDYSDRYYQLTKDIDLAGYGASNGDFNEGKGWVPIGTYNNPYYSLPDYPFSGTFDGGGHEISGLHLGDDGLYSAGLFGYVSSGTIKNLGIVGADITGNATVGGVAGVISTYGSVENCYASGTVSGYHAGGVAGSVQSNGSVKNCYATAEVSASGFWCAAGGVAGSVQSEGSVENCYAAGKVSSYDDVGGVAGSVYGSVKNCYATAEVSALGTSGAAGGVAGSVQSEGSVENCYAIGRVSGSYYVGGIAGGVADSDTSKVHNCAGLNPSINSDYYFGFFGRVTANNYYYASVLSNNAAFSGMTVTINDEVQAIGDSAADKKDGADISAADIKSDGTLGGRFTGEGGWTTEDGKLPLLTGLPGQNADLPYHISGNYFGGGDGSGEEEAFEISTPAQLAKLAELVNNPATNEAYGGEDVYYKLTADIDLSGYNASNAGFNEGKGWIPIGTVIDEDPIEYYGFKGVFDGNDHVVSGLYFNNDTRSFAGLFGCVDGGTVQNLKLEQVQITAGNYVGGLVGAANYGSILENCRVTGAVNGRYYVGGVTGGILGTVKNCRAEATVSGRDYVGGLAGAISNTLENEDIVCPSAIESCYVTGGISGRDYVGGLAGIVQGSMVENSFTTGTVSGRFYIGGLAGIVEENGTVKNCYAAGAVSGEALVGGLAGYVKNSCTVASCYAAGAVSGYDNVGGVAGAVNGSTLQNCAALGPSVTAVYTKGIPYAGRVIGYVVDSSTPAYAGESTFSGNAAFSGMTVTINDEVQAIEDGAADNTNGVSASAALAYASAFWTETMAWDDAVWNLSDNRLPTLKGFDGGVPSGDGLYLTIRDIGDATVTLSQETFSYDTNVKMPDLTVAFDGRVLVKAADYTVDIISADSTADGTSGGTNIGTVTLKLSGIGNYTGERADITYTIVRATPVITVKPTASAVSAGSDLSASTLRNGAASVDGTFVWKEPQTKVNTAGEYTVTFLPEDTAHYNAVELMVSVSVSSQSVSSGRGSSNNGGAATKYEADISGEASGKTEITVDRESGEAAVLISENIGATDGKNITVTMPAISGVTSYTLGIPVPNLSVSGAPGTITLSTDKGDIILPSNMFTGTEAENGNMARVTIGTVESSALPDEVKEAVGDRPVISLTLSIDGTQTEWNNPSAPVTVSIPYHPTAEELENPESIVIWYIDGSGNAVCIPNGRYDAATGMVTFTTVHFSDYAVVYNRVIFDDVPLDAWYSDAVSFIAAREITVGTAGGRFNPGATLTRGQLIVLLMRSCGMEPDAEPSDNFDDAGDTYYTGYLAAAKRLGIANGVGDNKFAPENAITRQEWFTLLYNALKVTGQLPKYDCGKRLSDFADSGNVADWAQEAMTALVGGGIISGSGGKLLPTDSATRAQMAQILYNLLTK